MPRNLLRGGSYAAFESGSRRYHDFNLYCAGFGPFLAAAVAQAAVHVVTQAQFVPRLCSGSGSGWLHPQLEVVFGDERGVLKALSRTASYEVELAQKLEQLESYFRQLHSADDSSSINEEEGRQTAVEAAGAAAMVAILQEVVEGQVSSR